MSFFNLERYTKNTLVANLSSGTSCVSPPLPPQDHFLIGHFNESTIVPFGGAVNYTCPPGLFFGSNQSLEFVSVSCHSDGSLPEPLEWDQCFHPSRETCDNVNGMISNLHPFFCL